MSNDIDELEQRHSNYARKAKRKPQWQRAADRTAKELIEAKEQRVEELQAELPDEGRTPIERVAVAQLQDISKHEVAELRDELNRHQDDIAELESQ